ncbi:MAG: 3-methyl-2-oxobutanoate hydroxymethyltransferase, partial [Pseudomonadota bacterium]|nr:3-methyl-2-oxobutanoate hydroxymethyltransferase [Pseudomonadota bacterium]
RELAAAGAAMLVLELVPSALAAELAAALPIPLIGIGAGPSCGGQVLVLHDMLGITGAPVPRFVRNFMNDVGQAEGEAIGAAVRRYVAAVKDGTFPAAAVHTY